MKLAQWICQVNSRWTAKAYSQGSTRELLVHLELTWKYPLSEFYSRADLVNLIATLHVMCNVTVLLKRLTCPGNWQAHVVINLTTMSRVVNLH